jgi:hypothetical protein
MSSVSHSTAGASANQARIQAANGRRADEPERPRAANRERGHAKTARRALAAAAIAASSRS